MPFWRVGCSAKLLPGFPQTTLTPFLGNPLVCGYRLFRAHGNKQSAEKHGAEGPQTTTWRLSGPPRVS